MTNETAIMELKLIKRYNALKKDDQIALNIAIEAIEKLENVKKLLKEWERIDR